MTNNKKVRFTYEQTKTGFSAGRKSVFTTGKTIELLKQNAVESYNLWAEAMHQSPITIDQVMLVKARTSQPSEKEKLARNRGMVKWRTLGSSTAFNRRRYNETALTVSEKKRLDKISFLIQGFLDDFTKNSERLGLKTKKKGLALLLS